MSKELSRDEVAALIRARKILNARGLAKDVDIKELAIAAGIGTSLDFLIPVGTPPSAIAYSSGYVSVKDMFRAGIFITIAGILLLTFLAWLYW